MCEKLIGTGWGARRLSSGPLLIVCGIFFGTAVMALVSVANPIQIVALLLLLPYLFLLGPDRLLFIGILTTFFMGLIRRLAAGEEAYMAGDPLVFVPVILASATLPSRSRLMRRVVRTVDYIAAILVVAARSRKVFRQYRATDGRDRLKCICSAHAESFPTSKGGLCL